MEISIIIPVYNSERYIGKCLQSVLDQTFTDFEILLINDGSIDKSSEIINNYKQLDKRIKVYNQVNSGVSSARNIGLDHSTGRYVAFIDSDDYIDNDYLFNLYSCTNINTDYVFSGMYDTYSESIKKKIILEDRIWNLYKEDDLLNFLYCPLQSSPCAKLYSNHIIQKYHLRFDTSFTCAEDRDFNLKFFSHINKAKSLSYSGYYYRRDVANSLTKKDNPNGFHNRCLHWRVRRDLLTNKNCNNDKVRKKLANDLYNIAYDEIIYLSTMNHSFNKTISECKKRMASVDFHYLKEFHDYINAPTWQKKLLINRYFFLLILINRLYLYGKKKG